MKIIVRLLLGMTILPVALISCRNHSNASLESPALIKRNYGMVDGNAVYLYTLSNKNGVTVSITNYGGTITSWVSPDKYGNRSNIVLGFDSLSGYLAKPPYFGALIGRYGNRIAGGKFRIGDSTYILALNNGRNHLHGGIKGFDKVVWKAKSFSDSVPKLALTYVSKDGEEGYPGNLKVEVIYTLTDANELEIEYNAETDKATPINLTQHSYFNLTGNHTINILNHSLKIDADYYTPVDSSLIPTGKLLPVIGTPFDFREPHKIGGRIEMVKGGYDHNFVLNRKDSSIQLVAVLTDSLSGRELKVFTTEPGLQFYSGNFLNGTIKGSDHLPFSQYAGLCLETQHFPNSPNEPKFPSTILLPGRKYHTVTKYKISVN